MNTLKYFFLLSISLAIFISSNLPVLATLGYSAAENEAVYGQPGNIPKYHYNGSKDVIIYNKDNLVITVVYRNGVSILEDINYNTAVNPDEAQQHITNFILPHKGEKASFSSSMPFAEGYFQEDLYKNGIKTKIIYNDEGKATEVISSMMVLNQAVKVNGL